MKPYKNFAALKQSIFDIESGSEPRYGGKVGFAGKGNRDRTGLVVRGNPDVLNEAAGGDQHAGTFKSRKRG